MKIQAYYIILIIISSICLLSSCGYEESNKKPNDYISKVVSEAVGESAYYIGNETYEEETKGQYVVYSYLIKDFSDADLFQRVTKAANEGLKTANEDIKYIRLCLCEEIPGGYETVAVISNYRNEENEFVSYSKFQSLKIFGNLVSEQGEQSRYNKATTYILAEDIKSLVVTDKIAENAKAEGIDWYKVWPDLEYYEVYTR